MARTRATKSSDTTATKSSSTTTASSASIYTLPPTPKNPPKVFILPTRATKEARIVSLLHPRYAQPTRYLVCPDTGIYEFTRIAAPKTTPRSWLIHSSSDDSTEPYEKEETRGTADFGTYVTHGAELFVATSFDPLFLVLPTLTDPSSSSSKRQYISSDDHFDRIQESSPHLWEILRWGSGAEGQGVRALIEERLAAVCDTVEAGDERMYRFSESKLSQEILAKARRMSNSPLPASMEAKFVVKPLEAPVMGVKRPPLLTPSNTTQTEDSNDDSQSSTATTTTSTSASDATSQPSTAASSFCTSTTIPSEEGEEAEAEALLLRPAITASAEVLSQQRLKVAHNFLISSYVPPALVPILQTHLKSAADLSELDSYLAELHRLKNEAAVLRNNAHTNQKRARLEDEEAEAERAEKRRKKEEDDRRKKAGESRGLKELKKVNTAGMKKMSDFFKKKV